MIHHFDRVTFAATESKYHRLGLRAWTFALLHPLHAARLRGRDVGELSDRKIAVLLEVAYARGMVDGALRRGTPERDGGDP